MGSSARCTTEEYEKAIRSFALDTADLSARMSVETEIDYLLDDDLSWEQLFSKRAETDPETEVGRRIRQLERSAEEAGKVLAREACRNLEAMIREYRRREEYGNDFVYCLLVDHYLPLVTDARGELITECARMKQREEELRADLEQTAEETAEASRLGGEREARTLDYLSDADHYLEYAAKERMQENLIRVLSTILSYCQKKLPENNEPAEPAKEELQLSYPRRCTITTDDGISYAVEISDGVDRVFESSQSLEQALETAKRWMQ
ncbi:MAG: hypothetical protein Q4B09_08625 [Lachnospiraceae bacterium]|nr:hypothetical protein [Lachnospiraceae bacterium]